MENDEIYLVQTDTTVGFLSHSKERLNYIKNRAKDQNVLITTANFHNLKNLSRVPKKFKKFVRRSNKTTFIYPNNNAIRVVKDKIHRNFLKKYRYLYSTSANRSGKRFDRDFAYQIADVIVVDFRDFFEQKPSNLIKLSKNIKKKLR